MKIQIALCATPILYHITTARAAANIVAKNRFELKPSDGTQAEEATQATSTYYLSTARHKTASYTRQNIGINSVIFVLNGNALSSKYKIKSVDYWAGFYRDNEEMNNRDRMEAEDRVLSNTPFIEHADRYVTEIHAYRGKDKIDFSNNKAAKLIALYKFAKMHKIDIYFYNDRHALLLLDKRRAVPLDHESLLKEEDRHKYNPSEYDYKYRKRHNEITGWLQLWDMPAQTDYKKRMALLKTKDARSAYDHLAYNYNGDPVRQLSNGMHNEKSVPYGHISRGREDLDRLVKILRQHKWVVKDFTDALYVKWFPKDQK